MNNSDLRYKIGQMLVVGFDGTTVDRHALIVQQINKFALGGVILFDYNFNTNSFVKNIESPQQVAELNKNLQLFNQTCNQQLERPNLPLLISVDYEGGKVNRLKENYGFPATYSAEEVTNMPLHMAQEIANNMANTLKSSGFNVNFAPVVDLNITPENPVLGKLGRCFGREPQQVINYANIYAQEFMNAGVLPVFKHFPGHGSSTEDSHLGFVDVTDTWQVCELEPYKYIDILKNSNSMIMTAHIVNRNLDESGLPATLSVKTLQGLLRDKLRFSGLIISDDMQMKAISENYSLEDSLTLAINAGVDMLIFGNQLVNSPQDPGEIIDIVAAKVQQGIIASKRIDEAFMRIKALKTDFF